MPETRAVQSIRLDERRLQRTTGLLPPAGAWTAIFRTPCELHDFGYRNLGKGLALQRTNSRRGTIDSAFKREMRRVCSTRANRSDKLACHTARSLNLENIGRTKPIGS